MEIRSEGCRKFVIAKFRHVLGVEIILYAS